VKRNNQYENFERTMTELLKVPHSVIKAKLDAEKKAKKERQRKAKDREKL
jgi:hypothetical protein